MNEFFRSQLNGPGLDAIELRVTNAVSGGFGDCFNVQGVEIDVDSCHVFGDPLLGL